MEKDEARKHILPILGIGTDIIETQRIRDLLEREPAFAERVFTEGELAYSLPKPSKYLHLAARFAAKEAVAKALGHSFSWQDVEITNNGEGKPEIILHGRAKEAAGQNRVHISISHTKSYASAVAIVESD